MQYVLIIMAVTICLLYLPYLAAILLGQPGNFETKAVLTLAVWIRDVGVKSKRYLESIYLFTALLEIAFFTLALLVIKNTFLFWFTWAFIGFEILHFIREIINLRHFFGGSLPIKDILYWRYERLSCLLFCMYAILLIFNLLVFTP
ncbi:MAG: hypothetical protein ACM3NT_07185 [Methylocystaceae bacterium]